MEEIFELTEGDADYPPQLRETPHPPRVLYGRGNTSALGLGLAVIGARRATPSGLDVTRTLAGWAAAAGYPVISGAAYGCDQAAHRAALDAGGVTVAVMGCGVDVSYPRSAQRLLDAIATSGGAVVSEYPWGTQPKPWMFRQRNRIIAGLSAAVLVVEAGLPSGTFSTADEALGAGRAVLAVPGSILSQHARGPNRLIRQGATPITEVPDLADELAALLGPPKTCARSLLGIPSATTDPVLAAIRACPMRVDDLSRALGIDTATVCQGVGVLEAAGRIERHYDGTYHALVER